MNSQDASLAARAIDAFRMGRTVEWTSPPAGPTTERLEREEKRHFRFGPLTSADRATLATLSAPREHALALARARDLDRADASMKAAELLLALAHLASDARAYAETMHQAAVSYLEYQRGNYAAAQTRMQRSIEATDRLAAHWGDTDFIVCRRVDLAHNLMRVEMRRGSLEAAMQRGARLLRHILEVRCDQSSDGPGAPAEPAMDATVARILYDLVTGTASEIIAPLERGHANALFQLLPTPSYQIPSPSPGASMWWSVTQAALGPEPERFLREAAPFLRAGRGRTPSLWYSVTLDLIRIYRAIDPDDGLSAADELEAELETGPRVPERLRLIRREHALACADPGV